MNPEVAEIERQDVRDRLCQNTNRAVACGMFRTPTCFVGLEMLWANDRFDFVEEALHQLAWVGKNVCPYAGGEKKNS